MDGHILTIGHLISFKQQLRSEEREQSTIEKYMRELKLLGAWLQRGLLSSTNAPGQFQLRLPYFFKHNNRALRLSIAQRCLATG